LSRQLFDDSVAVRPRSARSRWTVLFSTVAHLVIIAVAVIVPLLATGGLPDVRQQLTAFMPVDVQVPDLPPPAPAPHAQALNRDAAPTVAPTTIDYTAEPPPATGPTAPGTLSEFDFGRSGDPGVPGGIPAASAPVIVAPPPEPPKPLRPGGDIRAPERLFAASPVYPSIARSAGIQGDVILEAIIDTSGTVRDVRVLRSVHLLDQAAIDAVKQWRYKPTLLNGVPVPIVMTVTVSFRLQ
jgi:periplasmic protein TonB